jgi:hypothetical protein
MRVGLVELPAIKLCDDSGRNWTAFRQHEPLVSKQVLLAQLNAFGIEASLVNLKCGRSEHVIGQVRWGGLILKKIFVGTTIEDYSVEDFDIWGFTVNYMQEREIAIGFIRYLSSRGARTIVGGSDAIAVPAVYIEAGATAIVTDKSGAINQGALEYVMGQPRSDAWQQMTISKDGRLLGRRGSPLSPERWPLPDLKVVTQCLGTRYWEGDLPENLLPIGSAMVDIGCDRKCGFCQTPTYKLGYQRMSPTRALQWFARQKSAGARSVICPSDQFLGRVLWPEGRSEVMEIMEGIRDLGLAVLWGNGLEIKKATRGRGFAGGDSAPDEALCQALWGWDGRVGCYNAYIPGERPMEGDQAYQKLLPWKQHVNLVRTIIRTGVPDITYGVIIGMPEDCHDQLAKLEEALHELWYTLKSENHNLRFRVTPFAVRPIHGTPQSRLIEKDDLLATDDLAIRGGFWTACANTRHLSYQEVSHWQHRLAKIGDMQDLHCQGVTGLVSSANQNMLR